MMNEWHIYRFKSYRAHLDSKKQTAPRTAGFAFTSLSSLRKIPYILREANKPTLPSDESFWKKISKHSVSLTAT